MNLIGFIKGGLGRFYQREIC